MSILQIAYVVFISAYTHTKQYLLFLLYKLFLHIFLGYLQRVKNVSLCYVTQLTQANLNNGVFTHHWHSSSKCTDSYSSIFTFSGKKKILNTCNYYDTILTSSNTNRCICLATVAKTRNSCFCSVSHTDLNHWAEFDSFFFRTTGGARVPRFKGWREEGENNVWHFSTAEKALSKVIMNCLV